MEVHAQLISFLTALLIGMVLGLIFDFFRIVRGVLRLRLWMTNLLDGLYWVVATLITFTTLLLTNWGELRFYLFMGIAAGAGAYYRWVSKTMLFVLIRFLRVIAAVCQAFKRFVDFFFIRPAGYFFGIFSLPFQRSIRWYENRRQKKTPEEDP